MVFQLIKPKHSFRKDLVKFQNNVLNFLGAINYNDEDYELEEFDLQNNILKYYDRWSSSSDSDTIIVKIIKITNKEFGTIENG